MITKPTALIIDDQPDIAEIAVEVATDCGFDARAVHDGTALDAAACASDVIVLDLLMPGMDGVEVLRRLAKAGSRARLILMSGMDRRMLDSARKVASMQHLNVADVLQKPFRPAELRVMLNAILADTTRVAAPAVRHPGVAVLVRDLEKAIKNDELRIHYQPQICLADRRWTGVEALVRWEHPVHGLLYPDSFVHLAETCEPMLALPFTYEVLRKAATDCVQMTKSMGFHGSLAVNVPPAALTEVTVPERLLDVIRMAGLEQSRLVVEITENSIPADLSMCLDIQTRLRMRGIQLSIDDFGTGHSSLERLHDAPFDELKIDMMFVRGSEDDPALRAIAESAVALGHSLGMKVVAEGVETAQALAWLSGLGCDFAQGYHIGRPMPMEGLREWAAARNLQLTQPA